MGPYQINNINGRETNTFYIGKFGLDECIIYVEWAFRLLCNRELTRISQMDGEFAQVYDRAE